MKKIIILVSVLSIFLSVNIYAQQERHNYKPKEGYVPNETVAIKIAEAILIPIYGEEDFNEEKPHTAKLKDGVWIIEGTLHAALGGVAEIEISKDDGRILRVTHGK